MKIIITVNTYYPLTDGVQAVTQYEAEGLAQLGNDVTVVTVRYPGQKKVERHNGVNIIRYNIATKHSFYVGDVKGYRRLIISLCSSADVLLNICTQTATTEVLFPVFDKIKCKKVLYMHGFHDFHWHSFDFNSLSSFAHKFWNNIRWKYDYIKNKNYIKQYSKVIQLHEMDESNIFFYKKYGIKSYIINNSADKEFFSRTKSRKKSYALCVANYIPGKNQEFIMKAFYLSKQKDLSLILIGSKKNSYYDHLIKVKKIFDNKYGKREIKLLYDVPREKISSYVKNASLYLLGSKKEAFPISIVEAMAGGIPYISTDVGIVKYLPGGEVVDSEAAMAFWIDLFTHDRKVANEIGKIGNNFAKLHFSEQKNVNKLNNILMGNY